MWGYVIAEKLQDKGVLAVGVDEAIGRVDGKFEVSTIAELL